MGWDTTKDVELFLYQVNVHYITLHIIYIKAVYAIFIVAIYFIWYDDVKRKSINVHYYKYNENHVFFNTKKCE